MLKTRVITALVLVSLLLPSLFFLPQGAWSLLVAAFIAVAAWEWGALLSMGNIQRLTLGAIFGLGCAALSVLFPDVLLPPEGKSSLEWLLYGLAGAFWGGVIPFWLRGKWPLKLASGLLVAVVVLIPTWLAMVQLRAFAPGVLLSIFAVVWMADIAAYFAGRAFGKHKLAPAISPGKTWEGAFGAIAGVLFYGMVMRHYFYQDLMPLPHWVGLLLLVTAVSIVGDLFESLLKRKAGIKDSSNILPGHGGVLDRIDSLTSTLPVVSLICLLFISAR